MFLDGAGELPPYILDGDLKDQLTDPALYKELTLFPSGFFVIPLQRFIDLNLASVSGDCFNLNISVKLNYGRSIILRNYKNLIKRDCKNYTNEETFVYI